MKRWPTCCDGTVPAQQSVFQESRCAFLGDQRKKMETLQRFALAAQQEGLPETVSASDGSTHQKGLSQVGPVTPPLAHLPLGWCASQGFVFCFHEPTLGLGVGSIMRQVSFFSAAAHSQPDITDPQSRF